MSHRRETPTASKLETGSSTDPGIASVIATLRPILLAIPKPSQTGKRPIELERLQLLPGGIEIWSVDGTEIRKRLDNDFLLGDNWMAPPHIVPRGHIWVERILDPLERYFILIHEVTEVLLMTDYKYSYKKAHGIASQVELHFRKLLS